MSSLNITTDQFIIPKPDLIQTAGICTQQFMFFKSIPLTTDQYINCHSETLTRYV